MAAIEHDLTGLLTLGRVNVAKHLLRSMSIFFTILTRFGRIGTDICKEKRVLQHFFDLQYYLTEMLNFGNCLQMLSDELQNYSSFKFFLLKFHKNGEKSSILKKRFGIFC